ncbi:MAG: site-specific DNA-methyltransferase, partial [Vicinamibacterales bacterium]
MAKRTPKTPKGPTPVEAIKHKDTRKNIPTEELRDFVADDERAPKTMLYPRDPSLDPQLVWKGKDEQDQADLAVPVVPIYIQEKVHPQAIIEHLRTTAKAGEKEPELTLFDDFNGLEDFDKKVDFYRWDQHWSNRMILGDSLLVMTSLAEKEGLKGKVQMIYVDPPYGIKFGSNWQVSTRRRDVKDGRVEDATRQPEQVRAFRDTWKLGIHSYLAYLRDRLVVSRELLTETGSVFVQIGDENVHLVRSVLDEVFGAENFCAQITFRTTSALSSPTAKVNVIPSVADLLLWYAKDARRVKYRQPYLEKSQETDAAGVYSIVEAPDGSRRRMTQAERVGAAALPNGARLLALDNITSSGYSAELSAPFEFEGRRYVPGENKHWKTTLSGMGRLASANRVASTGQTLRYVRYIDDFPVYPLVNVWPDTGTGSFTDDKVYVVQTGLKAIERCVQMSTDPGDLVIDPTCGSGTTALAAEQWGRRWITCDTSRVALTLARTRLMSARFPWFLLTDSPEGQRKEAEVLGKVPPVYRTENDVRKGFVCRRVPHVTLRSIANNPEIRQGMSTPEIHAAILRHADMELLLDKPYDDAKRVRVTGPFTVESLSPHRVLPADDERPASEQHGRRDAAGGQFETMILDNLRRAGVQNTVKNERLTFDRLEPVAGTWLQASGAYTDSEGKVRRVAVSIGPEHGTVGPTQVKEAAKEAVLGVGYDVLVVCGF